MAKAPAKAAQTTAPDKLSNTPSASKEDLLRFYREMVLIRRFEERAGQLYGMGLIGGDITCDDDDGDLGADQAELRNQSRHG